MASTGTTLLYDTFRNRVQIASFNWSAINATPEFGFGRWKPYWGGGTGFTVWGISTLGTTTSYLYGLSTGGSQFPIGISIGKLTNYDVEWSANGQWGGNPSIYPNLFLRLPSAGLCTSAGVAIKVRMTINQGSIQLIETDATSNSDYDQQSIPNLTIPINPIYNGIYTTPHNFKISVKGRQIDVYMGLAGVTPTYRGTFYSVANLNNPIPFTFTNALNSLGSITYPYCTINSVKITSNADIDYSPIFYDSFNRPATTGITVGSPSFGGPYSSVGTNAGISFITVASGISLARLYSSNDISGFSSSIFKDIFPNTNNFRFEFDENFAPVAGTTGRAFIPYFRYNTTDSSYLWLDLRTTGVSLNWTIGGVTTTIASGATTHSAGVTYRYAVQVKNDQIDIISQSTVTTTGITIISQTGVTYNNAAAQNQIGFNYYKGSAEASAYNTYLNNFVIFDLGSQSTVLGEFQAQDDIQFKTFSQIDRDSQNTADIIYQKDIVKIAIDGTTTTDVQFKGFSTATKNDVISPTDITTIENSLLFDGNGDYVNTGVTTIAGVGLFATSTSVWSIEFWFNSTAFAATGSADYLINRSAGPNSSRTFQIRVNDTGNIISFVRGSSTTLATSTTAPLDSWNHLALTWNGTNAYAYLNGGATIAVSVGTAAEQTSEFIVFGGDNNSNVVSYNGYLSDIRIWNTARTQTQIQTNRSQRIYGQSGLIGYWKLNEATGSTIAYDSLGNINAPVTGAGFTQNSVFIIAPNSLVKAITKPQQDGITTTDVQFKSLSKSLTADGITTTDITSKLLAKSLSDSQGSTDSQIVKRFAIIPSDEVITVSGIIRGKAFSDTVYSLDGPYERYSNYAIGYVFGSSLPIKIQQQIIQKLEISSRIITNKRNQ